MMRSPAESREERTEHHRIAVALEDRRLVSDFLRRREEKAFRALYRRYAPVLYRFVLRYVRGNELDAEDTLQTTWVRVIENLADFRWESSLRSWLTGIALNCAREAMRKHGRGVYTELDETEDLSTAPRITRVIDRIDLERVIAMLPDGYREVLILHDIEGYTHGEISTLLGVESGTSKSQLARARRAVRVRLTKAGKHQNE
jgi:RNA polymerase sigma-70 factor (ECF subfamily)